MSGAPSPNKKEKLHHLCICLRCARPAHDLSAFRACWRLVENSEMLTVSVRAVHDITSSYPRQVSRGQPVTTTQSHTERRRNGTDRYHAIEMLTESVLCNSDV